jgi:FixJ family two-component response regulator
MNLLNSEPEQRPRVLSLGNDASLLRSRQFVLEGAGFEVLVNIDVEQTVPDFDYNLNACVLCHSISLKQRLKLAASIRERIPQAGVVFIYYGNEMFDARNVDALLRTPVRPDDLVTAVRRAMKKAEAR